MTSKTLICAAAICGAVLAVSGLAGTAEAQSLPPEFEIDVGGWTGGAQGNNDTGQLTHCAISRKYGNNVTLALLLSPRYELNIGLLNPAWNLLPDEEEAADATEAAEAEPEEEEDEEDEPPMAEVNVDGIYVKSFRVRTVSDTLLMVTTGINAELVDMLMKGNNLDVATDYGNYRFALSGTFNSITALRGCIDTGHRLAEAARAASGRPGAVPLNDRGIVNILTDAGLEDAEVARPDPATSSLALSYSWRLGQIIGGVHQSPRGSEVEIDKFAELYIDQFETLCTQAFQRSEGASQLIRERHAIKTATMRCGDEATGVHVSMFIVLDDNFYTAFHHQGPIPDEDGVDEATDRIRQVIEAQANG